MLRSLAVSGFAILLLSGALFAEQEHAGSQSSHHKKTTRRHATTAQAQPSPTRVDVYNGATAQTQMFNAQLAPSHGAQAPLMHRVDVYNGSSKQMQVFSTDSAAGANSSHGKHGPQRNEAAAHPVSDVQIFNGTTRERRVFNIPSGEPSQLELSRQNRHSVVVGITSGGSGFKGQSAQPVVTGIASSGSGRVGNSSGPVVGSSPLPPKRPPYSPAPRQ